MRTSRSSRNGFTIVEVTVVIGLAALLMAAAVPAALRFLMANEIESAADRLAADLAMARQVAITSPQQGPVTLSLSTSPAGYSYVDGRGRVHSVVLPDNVTVQLGGLTSSTVVFEQNGNLVGTPATIEMSIALSPAVTDRYRIEVNRFGQVRTTFVREDG